MAETGGQTHRQTPWLAAKTTLGSRFSKQTKVFAPESLASKTTGSRRLMKAIDDFRNKHRLQLPDQSTNHNNNNNIHPLNDCHASC